MAKVVKFMVEGLGKKLSDEEQVQLNGILNTHTGFLKRFLTDDYRPADYWSILDYLLECGTKYGSYISEIAQRFHIHPAGARYYLEELRKRGFVKVIGKESTGKSEGGRPRIRYVISISDNVWVALKTIISNFQKEGTKIIASRKVELDNFPRCELYESCSS